MEFVWNLIQNNWETIAAFVLGIGLVSIYLIKIRTLLRQAAELFIALDNAFADSKVSKEEVESIKKEVADVWDAIKAFAKK
jgi:hypothetical protein